MQNTPDRHPRKIFRATIPAGFPGRIRHNKQVTATRPLQRNLAAAFRIAPNPGCAPGTGAAREQRRSSRNSRKNNGRNSGGSNGRENVRRRITSKNPERHLQSGSSIRKIFNNATTVKSQLKLQNPVTIKQRNKPLNAQLSAMRRHKEKNRRIRAAKKSSAVNNLTINLYICDIVFKTLLIRNKTWTKPMYGSCRMS